ncbi:MAG: DUF2079 domain-containing protein [Burkholderiales bacterium]|nr:DUF2079 domain-containing protein [Burkholderiales bacterium]
MHSSFDPSREAGPGYVPFFAGVGLWSKHAPTGMLWLFALLFSAIFTGVAIQLHGVFQTSAYDIGIFDQAFWQYSHLRSTFNTVRGLNILGDHFSPIAFVFAPLYNLWPNIGWALALQTVSVTAGGILLYLIARHLLFGRAWIAVAVVASFYLHPAVHNTLLWQYHEIVLASGFYLALIWSYLKDRIRLFTIVLVLLLACREDMPFTLAAFGVLACIEKRWRFAAVALILSITWWVVVTRFAFPYFNGLGYYRHTHGVLSRLFHNFANPEFYLSRISDPQSLRYLWQIMLPAGLIGLFSPRYLLPALPTLAANVLIGNYNTNIAFHYSVSIMPFLYWAALMTMRRAQIVAGLRWQAGLLAGLAVLQVGSALWLGHQYSVLEVRSLPQKYEEWRTAAPKRELLKELDSRFGNEGVAATDFLLPHLAHRESIYLFPNPWKNHYWGIDAERPHHPNRVRHIVLSANDIHEHEKLYDYLLESGTFEKVEEGHGIIVLRRVKAEPVDRAQAVAKFENFSQVPPPAMTRISMSSTFSTLESEFRRLDVDLARLQKGALTGAMSVPSVAPGELLSFDLGEDGSSDFQTRYVRAEVHVKEPVKAHLDLGSDDGVTVWLNRHQIHENIILRAANVEDDHLSFILKPGKNVLVFRVNNATGAWRLQARIRATRCSAECQKQAGV